MIPDDDARDFFGLKTADPANRPVGLAVSPPARVIYTPDGKCWDELSIIEADYRREGRPLIMFTHVEDEDGPERWCDDRPGEAEAQAAKWAAIMGDAWPGPGLPTVQDVEAWKLVEWRRARSAPRP
jgi:hypothetical protein